MNYENLPRKVVNGLSLVILKCFKNLKNQIVKINIIRQNIFRGLFSDTSPPKFWIIPKFLSANNLIIYIYINQTESTGCKNRFSPKKKNTHIKILKKMEPPNDDVFHVKENLREVLLCFRSFETPSSAVPAIIRNPIKLINDQGSEFHECLQMSIAQSINLENYSKGVLSYAEALEDPVFDLDRILNVLETLLENSQKNMETTAEINNKFRVIKDAITKINNDTSAQYTKMQESLQRREWLRELEGIYTAIIAIIIFMAGLIFFGIRDDTLLAMAITMEVILAVTVFYFKSKNKDEIRRLNKLETQLRELESLGQNNLDKISSEIYSMAIQMVMFNSYWTVQSNELVEIENTLRRERNINDADQIRRILNGPMKDRWDSVRVLSGNYTRTVRGLIEDTRN